MSDFSELAKVLSTLPIEFSFRHVQLVVPIKGAHNDFGPHDLWEVVVSYQGQSYTTAYHTGIGQRKPDFNVKVEFVRGKQMYYKHSQKPMDALEAAKAGLLVAQNPKLADVMHSLLLDASCGAMTFEEWCDELGFDSDSRKALNTYLQCQETEQAMRKLFGKDLMEELASLEH